MYTDTDWQNTDKHLLNSIEKTKAIYAWKSKSYSSQFYTKGSIKLLETKEVLELLINKGNHFYLLSKDSQQGSIPIEVKEQLIFIGKNKKSQLFEFK